jgi:hypothetical protein
MRHTKHFKIYIFWLTTVIEKCQCLNNKPFEFWDIQEIEREAVISTIQLTEGFRVHATISRKACVIYIDFQHNACLV